jgi:hypothetical protein
MFETVFTLRQETPIIHFLHDQPGATLRATELKPKLDRFLLSKYGEPAIKDWIARTDDKGHISLDYKINILPTGTEHMVKLQEEYKEFSKKYETSNFPHLLSNMGGKKYLEDLKNLVLYDGAKVIVKTWHNDLLDILKKELPILIANENFGNRSGKGFGSFICTAVDGMPIVVIPSFKYHFTVNIDEMDTINFRLPRYQNERRKRPGSVLECQKSLFTVIDIFYKTLRSGINFGHRDFYFKSLLYRYVSEKLNEQWDKRSIKERYFIGDSTKGQFDHRDFLGLSTVEQWGKEPPGRWKYGKGEITKNAEGEDGLRFPSPMIFKPVRTTPNTFEVYFKGEVNHIEDFKKEKIKVQKNGAGELRLTPSPNFDLQNYLDFVFEEVDIKQHVKDFDTKNLGCDTNPIFTHTIQPIFTQIFRNLQNKA